MEIRNGYGTSGTRVAGPVRVGDPLTLIIYMRSKYGESFNYTLVKVTLKFMGKLTTFNLLNCL